MPSIILRQLRPAVTVWLLMALTVGFFGMIVDNKNLTKFHDIMKNQSQSVGVITGTNCADHDSLFYSFQVGATPFHGGDHGGCYSRRGQAILVYYDSADPEVNASANPTSAWWNEIITIFTGSIMCPSILMINFYTKRRRNTRSPHEV